MLISLKISNCFIYDEEIEFNMRADMRFRRFPSNVARFDTSNILKTAILLGPNNTGKTSFVKCIQGVKNILLNHGNHLEPNQFSDQPYIGIEVRFLNENEYEFEIRFDSETRGIVYERFTEITFDKHHNEKRRNLYLRDLIENRFESSDPQLLSAIEAASGDNILVYLLDANRFPTLLEAKQSMRDFAQKIDIVNMNSIPMERTLIHLKKHDTKADWIANFVRNADLSLDSIRYFSDEDLFSRFECESKQTEEYLRSSGFPDDLHLWSVYKGHAFPSSFMDSAGTRKLEALAGYIIDALASGRIVVIDELDSSLHFRLTRNIISLFNNELNDSGQLICTVHDISLLDCKRLFRQEQIWFTHRDTEGVYLYPLSSFTSRDGVRETSNLIEMYKNGDFGALPEPDLFQSLLEATGND